MERPNKVGLEGGDSRSLEQLKKRRIGQYNEDDVTNLPSTSAETSTIENNKDTNENKDLEKLFQETCHLTAMNTFFPDLVWKNVMAKIVDKAAIEDCSNASPYFGKLLHGKRNREVVLPEVFSILSNYYQYIYKNEDEDELNPLTDLWKCRLVCKAWNEAIQRFLDDEDKIYFVLKYDFENLEIKNIEVWVGDSFRNDSGAQKFLAHFNRTHVDLETNQLTKNPFLGRCVHLFYDRDDGESVHHSFMDMLRIYGKEIWYFSLFYHFPSELADEDANRLVELYREVREMIYYMPRLRVFRMFYKGQILDDELPLDIRPSLQPTPEETLALNREIAQNPLPKFENLEFLVTTDLPTPIFNQLLHQNREDITQLEISRKDYHQDYELFGGEELPNLKILSLEFTSVEDFELFESCPLTFKLDKFHFYYDKSAQFLPWSRVFQALERKVDKNVCSVLILQMPVPKNLTEWLFLRETSECRLDFPNLKFLRSNMSLVVTQRRQKIGPLQSWTIISLVVMTIIVIMYLTLTVYH